MTKVVWLVMLGVLGATACSARDDAAGAPPVRLDVDAAASRPPADDPRTWRATAPMNTPRRSHTATLLRDGRVLVVGGEDMIQRMTDTTEIFDPKTETWTAGPKLPQARSNHVAVLLRDGRVLVAGGGKSTTTGQPLGGRVLADVLLFDPSTDSFTEAAPMNEARSHFPAVLLDSGEVLVIGGGGTAQGSPEDCKNAPYCGPFGVARATAEVFDANANRWSLVGPMAFPRNTFAATRLGDGRVLAIGGVTEKAVGYRSTEIFDPKTRTWTPGPDMRSTREHHTAITSSRGVVLVAGGKNPNISPLSTTETFDGVTTAWRPGPLFDEARTMPGLVQLESGRILVAGGFAQLLQQRGEEGTLPESFIFDDQTGSLAPIAPLGVPRVLHVLTLLADGRVLATGGGPRTDSLASCEIAAP